MKKKVKDVSSGIAIDGRSATGKGTVSKIVAKRLGFQVLDSGSLYRTIALICLIEGIDTRHCRHPRTFERRVKKFLKVCAGRIRTRRGTFFLDGMAISTMKEIRSPEIDSLVANFSKLPCVRRVVFILQRRFARSSSGFVAEGRDMTTVVFTDAELKIFLEASDEVRVNRRFFENKAKGLKVTRNQVQRDMAERDWKDEHRAHSPTTVAPDAQIIHTDHLSPGEIAAIIIMFWRRLHKAPH